MEVKINSFNELGLFTKKSYKKDDTIFVLEGTIFDKPSRETIHIGNNKHIYDKYGIYINHSFLPTVYINNFYVKAISDILEGTEITFDYNKNEIDMAAPFYVDGILICGLNKMD
jgi:hypothetical protein